MCGIAGILHTNGQDASLEYLRKMTTAIVEGFG